MKKKSKKAPAKQARRHTGAHPLFGHTLTALLKSRKITKKALAASLGVESSRLCYWARGVHEPPLYYVREIALRLDVTTDELLALDRLDQTEAEYWGDVRRSLGQWLRYREINGDPT